MSDKESAQTRLHTSAHLAEVDRDIVKMLVGLAHIQGWPIKDMMTAFRAHLDQHPPADQKLHQAYRDRLDILVSELTAKRQ